MAKKYADSKSNNKINSKILATAVLIILFISLGVFIKLLDSFNSFLNHKLTDDFNYTISELFHIKDIEVNALAEANLLNSKDDFILTKARILNKYEKFSNQIGMEFIILDSITKNDVYRTNIIKKTPEIIKYIRLKKNTIFEISIDNQEYYSTYISIDIFNWDIFLLHNKVLLKDIQSKIHNSLYATIVILSFAIIGGISIIHLAKKDKQLIDFNAKYNAVLRNINEVVFQANSDGEFTFLNNRWVNLTGYTILICLGKKISDFFEDDKKNEFIDLINSLKSNIIDETSFYSTFKNKNNSILYVEITLKSIIENNQKVIIGSIKDFTEKKLHEEEIENALEMAKQANKAKSKFLANISHEIRTPLNSIIGTTELLLEEEIEPEHLELLKTSHISEVHLLNLINDILDFSKIESNKINLTYSIFDINILINDIIEIQFYEARKKNITLNSFVSPDIPLIKADEQKIKQITLNILNNAIKFTNIGEISISVIVIKKTNEKITLEFKVEDTGIGIPNDKKSKIFDPFIQVEDDYSKNYSGTGLGLSICKKLVMHMGGELKLEDSSSGGSVFSYMLTFETIVNNTNLKETLVLSLKKSSNKNNEATLLNNKSILVVEDSIANQKLFKAQFKKLNVSISISSNGVEALKEYTNHKGKYDLIFMDCQMPILDGYQTTKKIREFEFENGGSIIIIALTANVAEEGKKKCFQVGMNDYLSKPVSINSLKEVLKKWNII